MIVAIDAKRRDDGFAVYVRSGTSDAARDAVEWAREAESRGAGEILLTSMDRDGTRAGFDCEMTAAVADAVNIPVIASGGAGGSTTSTTCSPAATPTRRWPRRSFTTPTSSVTELKRYLRDTTAFRSGSQSRTTDADSLDRSPGRPHRPAGAGREARHRGDRSRAVDRRSSRRFRACS